MQSTFESTTLNLVVYLPNFGQFLAQHDSPALERLCAAGVIERRDVPLEGFACKSFGIPKQMDWPIAAMSMLGYGLQPADQAYIQLNLVHFSLQRDFFELHPVHDLNAEDSASLRASLHQHFAQSGFECLATPDPHVLLVPIKRDMEVSTRLMSEVWGRDTRHYMPEGSDALPLRLLINEAQMILHEHPVNSARESQGLLAVNSIWLSGGGRLPEPIAKSKYSFFSSSPFIQGLAALTQAKHDQVPANFDALMPNQQTLLWLTQHQSLNQNWFEPILKALKFGKIKRLSLRVGIGDAAYIVTITPLDLWKFWRIKKPLIQYFSIRTAS